MALVRQVSPGIHGTRGKKALSPLGRLALYRAILALCLLATLGLTACRGGHEELVVSAAADLAVAFQEIGQRFEEDTGTRVVFNFGSTGLLARQVQAGAAVDVFAAASTSYVDELERQGRVIPGTRALYGRGRLALWTRADSPLRIERMEDLARPEVGRVAIANPDHAPYGIAAREALQAAGVWGVIQPRLVMGENVRQALQYAETGNVGVALVALSLSIPSTGRWVLVPQELHAPIDQVLAVIQGTRREAEARRFIAFVNGPQGRPIMRRYGFLLPGDEGVR